MKDNLKDILSNLQAEVDQQTLLKYLEGKLTAGEQHNVEKHTLNDDFESDALDGLQDIPNKAKISTLVEQLNQDLKKKTRKKKKGLQKNEASIEPWVLIAIVLILLIAIAGYFIIYKMKNS